MNWLLRMPRTLMLAAPVLLLMAPASASAAPATGAKAPAAKSAMVIPNNAIIPLPLNPVVSAAQRLCAARTASGLGFTILRPGTGPMPGGDATVLVNYVGYLAATGAVFDQAMQSPLPIDGVIPGFAEALQMVGRTGIGRFCIPAALGYGASASGPIPANSDLVFQIEVLDFRTAVEMNAVRAEGTIAPTTPPDTSAPRP